MKLNEEQYSAVTATEGYVRVIAGAGSGKTRTLVHRAEYLVNEMGIEANNILSISFTNKAVGELKKRLKALLGKDEMVFCSTFHGLCHYILSKDITYLNYPLNFVLIDETDKNQIMEEIYEELQLRLNYSTFKTLFDLISSEKMTHHDYVDYLIDVNGEKLIDDLKVQGEYPQNIPFKEIYYKYLKKQRKCYLLDFDDLILFVLHLFRNNKKILNKWQKRFEYIQVDEFQDVSKIEYELVDLLAKGYNNLFVVGDIDQTIYGWRGADSSILLNFDKTHKDCKTIIMNKNYRSTPQILRCTNSLIKNNKARIDYELEAVKNNGLKPIMFHAKDKKSEVDYIINEIIRLNKLGLAFDDISILYRGAYATRMLEEGLISENIPYVIYNGIEFYKRKEIKDVIAYLRLIVYQDDLSLERIINVPARKFGKKSLNNLKEKANGDKLYEALLEYRYEYNKEVNKLIEIVEEFKNKYNDCSILELLDIVLKKSGYEKMLMTSGDEERLENVVELKNSIASFEQSYGEKVYLEDFLTRIALLTAVDVEDKADKVKLMTIHTAKGLEFDTVFLFGLNEGWLPSRKIKVLEDMEEERRICYVALTRAKNRLYFTESSGIEFNRGELLPSRFIFDMNEDSYELIGITQDELKKLGEGVVMKQEDFTNYKVGDKVIHPAFGLGVIISEGASNYIIEFDGKMVRTISKRYKKLEVWYEGNICS